MPLAGSKHWKVLMNGSAFPSTAFSFYASRKAALLCTDGRALTPVVVRSYC